MTAYAIDDLEPNPFDERVAPTYDAGSAHMFEPSVLGPTVDVLHDLAGDGARRSSSPIGTGRVALPLAAARRRGPRHRLSRRPWSRELRRKPGGDRIPVTIGDMATTRVGSGYRVAYLVYNTITNLLTQDEQVECFRTVAAQLAPRRSVRHRGLRATAASDAARADRGALPRG